MVACVVEPETLDHVPDDIRSQFGFTQKYYDSVVKSGDGGGLFGISIDLDRCKGCGECAEVCGSRGALAMVAARETDSNG